MALLSHRTTSTAEDYDMNAMMRRIATGLAVAVAPAVITVGAATSCHAQATAANTYGPTSSQAAAGQPSQGT